MRGFRVVTDPTTAPTYTIATLWGDPVWHRNGSGLIDYPDGPADYQIDTAIYGGGGTITYFGLDATRKSLLGGYFYPAPDAVGHDMATVNIGDVLAGSGHACDERWARLLTPLPTAVPTYQTRGGVMDRGNGPERCRIIRGPANRQNYLGYSGYTQTIILPVDAPQDLYTVEPAILTGTRKQGTQVGGTTYNHTHFGLPPSVHAKMARSVTAGQPAPEYRLTLRLWLSADDFFSPSTTHTLASGTMTKDGTALGTDYYYAQEIQSLSGYSVGNHLYFSLQGETRESGGSWSDANVALRHTAPCGWPYWAIGEDQDMGLPFIPTPIFKRD
jgi:hypothetical protein